MPDYTQLIRGLLEGCILAIISNEECYGYSIIEKLEQYGFRYVQESTVYPILKRIENRGLFVCHTVQSSVGPPRKYYRMAEKGVRELDEFKSLWGEMRSLVDKIMLVDGIVKEDRK